MDVTTVRQKDRLKGTNQKCIINTLPITIQNYRDKYFLHKK